MSMRTKHRKFRQQLEALISSYSMENGSDTPDFILADYLADCLELYDRTTARRTRWHERAAEMEAFEDTKRDA